MKLVFDLSVSNERVTDAIKKIDKKINIENISRSGEKGEISLSGCDSAISQNLQNAIDALGPDVALKSVVKQVFTKELKPVQMANIEQDDDDDDDDDIQHGLDFNNMLNKQINMHVKKAKKNIKDLYNKLAIVISEYNNSAGNFSSVLLDLKKEIATMNLELSNSIAKVSDDMIQKHEKQMKNILTLDARMSELDSCIEKTVNILSARKK
jgi:hypothetical protein